MCSFNNTDLFIHIIFVTDITVDINTISINVRNITLTLSWDEPFNNLDPIVNYTVSCLGNVTCPSNFRFIATGNGNINTTTEILSGKNAQCMYLHIAQ